jgi:uncharacterized protein YjiS (DUF1127 family)
MTTLKTISEKFAAWRRYGEAVRVLSQLSDRQLSDIGIFRGDIETIARQSGSPRPDGLRTGVRHGGVAEGGRKMRFT